VNIALRLLHAAFAIALLGWLVTAYVERRKDLDVVRQASNDEHAETLRMQGEIEKGKSVRNGLKRDDPYVVEFIARERMQYTGANELAPPPR